MVSVTLRSRRFSAALHAGLWLLLLLVVIGILIGRRAPRFGESHPDPAGVSHPVPVAKLQRLFASTNWPAIVVDTASENLFATKHFYPPPAPPVVPPPTPPVPPPPTTRKVELTYQGYYSSGNGPKRALLRLGETLMDVQVGGLVVTNLFIVEAGMQTLTLTNSAAQTNVITLNTKKEVEVPL